jgi:transcriptional regulator with XRE-family HTH domain
MSGYEREDWSVRDDALRLYRENKDWTAEQVADHLGIDAATVKEWLVKNGRLRQIHNPQNRNNLKARRMRVIELAAQNHDQQYIARELGITDRTKVGRLLARGLEEMAAELRDQRAWEHARALHLQRIMSLVRAWTPRAIGGAENAPKYADLVLKGLAQIAQVSGFNTINVHATSGDAADPLETAEKERGDVLASLDTLNARLAPIIEGQLAGPGAQPQAELLSQNGLTAQHD